MTKRKTFTLTTKMTECINNLTEEWNVNASEAMRRLFAMGSFLIDELRNGNTLYSKKPGDEEPSKLVFLDE